MLNVAEAYLIAAAESQGLKLWEDPSKDNVPATKLDSFFHIEVGTFSGGTKTHEVQSLNVDITLTFWRAGHKDPLKGRRDALDIAEGISKVALKYKNHIGNDVKSVILNSITPSNFREDNDNVSKIEMSFTLGLYLGIN